MNKINNSFFYHGLQKSGKTTHLFHVYAHDYHRGLPDLCLNLYPGDQARYFHRTLPYMSCPLGQLDTLSLPYKAQESFNLKGKWTIAFNDFYTQHPKIGHVLIDEATGFPANDLKTVLLLIRNFYPKAPILMTGVRFDAWGHNLAAGTWLLKHVSHVIQTHHKCMLCNRNATRQLHVVAGHPIYDEHRYYRIVLSHRYSNHRMFIFTVCDHHYHHLPDHFIQKIAANIHRSHHQDY